MAYASRRFVVPLALAILIAPLAAGAGEFEEKIEPIVAKYCHRCHGQEKKKGGLDLARFRTADNVLAEHEVWKTAVQRINLHEMPPKGEPQLRHEEMALVDRWFQSLPKPKSDCSEIANDANLRWYKGYVASRRLTHTEYDNTLRDLLGVDPRPARDFPSDGSGGEGFDTAGNALFTSPILVERYLAAAHRVLAHVFEGLREGATPELRAAAERILIARPGPAISGGEAARRVLRAFMRRAFRRPVADAEVERIALLHDRAAARGDAYEDAVRLALEGVLVSPHFLFLVEPEAEKEGVYRLDPHQLASRLSYFLWSSMPDAELMALADSGALHDRETFRVQVRRLLADPRSRSLGETFAIQWLELGSLGTTVRPDPKLFPEFDGSLADSMRAEAAAFFHDVVAGNRTLLELLDARHTFLDARLAKLYGVPGIEGGELRRVPLTDAMRGGLLGMAAVHAATSFPARTSPVLRGKWVLEVLLGSRVPPPPPDVPSLPEAETSGSLTLRERLEAHRRKPECASCHDRMDPLGFGLENFDVLGRWREEDGGRPVDARGTLPSGETFASPADLKAVLLARKDEFIRHLAKKLLGYALGRELTRFDQCVIDDAVKAASEDGYRALALFETIALSYPFHHRFARK
jgi:hypothetical protein